jgi:hypothetical protein
MTERETEKAKQSNIVNRYRIFYLAAARPVVIIIIIIWQTEGRKKSNNPPLPFAQCLHDMTGPALVLGSS